MSNIKQETISGAKWGLLQKITMQPIQLIYGMVLAHLITPSEMGIVGLTSIFFAIAQQLTDAGFGSALIRKTNREDADICTMFWFNVFMSLVISGILFLLAPCFSSFYNQPELLWLTRMAAINMCLNSTASVHWTLYKCRRDFKAPAIINCVSAVAGMPICLLLAWHGWGVWALMWQSITTTLVSLTLAWLFSPWRPRFMFSKKSFLDLYGFGSKVAIASIMHELYVNSRTFIIGKFYTPAQLGLYNRGSSIAHIAPDMINGTLGGIMYPVLSIVQHDDLQLQAAYRKYVKIPTLIIAWFTMLLIAIAEPLVRLAYGEAWLPCVPYLRIVAIGWVANHMNSINISLLMIKGKSNLLLKLETVKKLISIGMLLVASTISVEAICWASAAYCHLAMVFNSYYTGKLLGITWYQQQKDFFPYLLYAAIACIPCYLCTLTTWPSLLQLMVGGSSALLLYIIPMHFLREEAYKELYNTFIIPKLQKKFSKTAPL